MAGTAMAWLRAPPGKDCGALPGRENQEGQGSSRLAALRHAKGSRWKAVILIEAFSEL